MIIPIIFEKTVCCFLLPYNGKVGLLEDGSRIIVREKSEEGSPTLERQFPNGSITKIRYGE
ncbi:hypothetical protein [Arachidicoccus rhizosphaerae]|uniref:hypothetical protein n=1 Tax=Arachidicoccus rhizosphaerae TaxID=551991 RepID=UPI000B889ABD|nr:hypothetical protein [Arachidicoccus rhizosphaerae]